MDYNPQESLQNTANTFGTLFPWTPKPWKMKVLHPQNMGYNPKNEGCRFPWLGVHPQLSLVRLFFSNSDASCSKKAMPRPLSFGKPQSVGCCSVRVGCIRFRGSGFKTPTSESDHRLRLVVQHHPNGGRPWDFWTMNTWEVWETDEFCTPSN